MLNCTSVELNCTLIVIVTELSSEAHVCVQVGVNTMPLIDADMVVTSLSSQPEPMETFNTCTLQNAYTEKHIPPLSVIALSETVCGCPTTLCKYCSVSADTTALVASGMPAATRCNNAPPGQVGHET